MTNPNQATPRPPQHEVDPRVYLAAERTFLAWIRTGLALMAFGFLLARIEAPVHIVNSGDAPGVTPALPLWMGVALLAIGTVLLLCAAMQHRMALRALQANRFVGASLPGLPFALAMLLALAGAALVVHLLR
ncbi:MAG: DUF202 domain-containing protein [Bryobacterales bacterium]|jgi:putative membrane protein|nr:DUF202 domain-containing protein [Bryobacterales bacterium]